MTSMTISNIWISAEHWPQGEWTPADDIVDILVALQDGTRWSGTVCSFEHVGTLTTRWARSGECLNGRYIWAANLILASDTSRPSIHALVEDLLARGEFRHALASVETPEGSNPQ